MKLGLKDPRPGAIKLELKRYLNYRLLPTPPDEFGHYRLISDWGMLGNGPDPSNPPELPSGAGDCAIAGPEHQIMCWNKVAGRDVSFTTDVTLKNYGVLTGFELLQPNGQPWPVDPETGEQDNPTDGGTDLQQMAAWWQKQGFVDASGQVHTIEAYVATDPGNLQEAWIAQFLFESVTFGFALPESAMEQTQEGRVWDVVPGSSIAGGHCVPGFGRANGLNPGVSWGEKILWTPRFFTTYNNQGIVPLSSEMMVRAVSVEGFNDKELRGNLADLAKAA